MSGTGENRHWRRSSTQPQPPQQSQQRQGPGSGPGSGTHTPRGGATPMNAVPGSVWGEGGKKPSTRGGDANVPAPVRPTPAPAPAASAAQERHRPVRDFNSGEVREFLKKRYQEAITDLPSAHHKVEGDSVAKRSSGAWGSRGNMSHQMPNGQDFFTALKKQLQSLEASKG